MSKSKIELIAEAMGGYYNGEIYISKQSPLHGDDELAESIMITSGLYPM